MNPARWLVATSFAFAAVPTFAGPPFLTDDPFPTDTGHWEIYGFTGGERRGSPLDADVGLDLNYGALGNVQLTATLPFSFSHAPIEGWRSGTGDVELGMKYRIVHDSERGISAAIFPRAILATAGHAPGGKTRFLLPPGWGRTFPAERASSAAAGI